MMAIEPLEIDEQKAYVLRMKLGGEYRIEDALKSNEIMVGWSRLPGLLEPELDQHSIRQLVKNEFYPTDDDFRRAGADTGEILRFRQMRCGDLVVVPQPGEFYIARVAGPPKFKPACVEEDTAYRRPVEWLNQKEPIRRALARSLLQSRMRYQRTLVEATDLLDDIRSVLSQSGASAVPSFDGDLRSRLIEATRAEILSGMLNQRSFEELVASVIRASGASQVRIVARNQDKGADIVAIVDVVNAFALRLAVQVKYYRPEPRVPAEKLDELIRGMTNEDADLGIFVTSGTFSEEFLKYADDVSLQGKRIKTIDGEQLAALIVESGLKTPLT